MIQNAEYFDYLIIIIIYKIFRVVFSFVSLIAQGMAMLVYLSVDCSTIVRRILDILIKL